MRALPHAVTPRITQTPLQARLASLYLPLYLHYISPISPRTLQARLARLRKARLVVLPVNDNPDSERSGGGHWSCLAFRRLADTGALDRAGVSPG